MVSQTIAATPDHFFTSEAWGPPQFQEKRSRSEKAILGALGAFRGILGATLGIRNSILGVQNSILGIASHDLSNTKTTILGATPRAIPGIDGNPHEGSSFAPSILGAFFQELGWSPRARLLKNDLSQFKDSCLTRLVSQKKLGSEAYRYRGVARIVSPIAL